MDRDVVNLAVFGMHQHLSAHAADKINCVIARVEDRRRVNGVADKGRNYQCEARARVGAHRSLPVDKGGSTTELSVTSASMRAAAGEGSNVRFRADGSQNSKLSRLHVSVCRQR